MMISVEKEAIKIKERNKKVSGVICKAVQNKEQESMILNKPKSEPSTYNCTKDMAMYECTVQATQNTDDSDGAGVH